MSPRPRSVTIACLWAGLGAGLSLFTTFATLSDWGSTQVQDTLNETLDDAYLSGVSVDDLLRWGQWALTIVLIASIAALVFAVWTARGHRPSRIGLTVLTALALPVFLLGGIAGLLPAVVCAMVLSLLWNRESRAFFRGAPVDAVTGAPTAPARPDPFAGTTPPVPGAGVQSPAPGDGRTDWPAAPTAQAPTAQTMAPQGLAPQGLAPRPGAVLAALWLSLVSSLLGAAFCALLALGTLLAGDQLEDELRSDATLTRLVEDAGVTFDQLLVGVAVLGVFGVLWGLFGAVATVLAWRRLPAGRVLLIIAAAVSAVLGLVTMPIGLPVAAIAAFVVIALASRPAAAWFANSR